MISNAEQHTDFRKIDKAALEKSSQMTPPSKRSEWGRPGTQLRQFLSIQHSNSDAVIALRSFISPSRLAISWLSSSVLYEGWIFDGSGSVVRTVFVMAGDDIGP